MISEEIWLYLGMLGSIIAIIIVLVYILVVFKKNKEKEYPIHDERKVRIVERSATISFYISLFSMSLLMIISIIAYEFYAIGSLDSINYLMFEILIMAISYLCIYAYYSKKGIT